MHVRAKHFLDVISSEAFVGCVFERGVLEGWGTYHRMIRLSTYAPIRRCLSSGLRLRMPVDRMTRMDALRDLGLLRLPV